MPAAKSFMKSLFNGSMNESLLHHFPFFNTPREEDFSLMYKSIDEWCKENVNAMKFDDDKKLPPEVLQGLREMGLFPLLWPLERTSPLDSKGSIFLVPKPKRKNTCPSLPLVK
jgi:alkylation response protein AidB-like acyl-CoA dehydrogenase